MALRKIPDIAPHEAWDSPNVDTWRRELVGQVEDNANRIVTSLQGTWDQVADNVEAGSGVGAPLLAASNFQDGDYYVATKTGVVADVNGQKPEIVGQSLAPNDQVLSIGGEWFILSAATDYLSSVIDDTAAGVITFALPAVGTNPATANGEYIRKGESDAADLQTETNAKVYADNQDAAHAALQADPDDIHGTKTYTDAQDAAHAALQADPDDIHGTKTYTDGEIANHLAAPNPHGSMVWKGDWDGAEHEAFHVVRDGLWLMIANKTTTDRPAPQPDGNRYWVSDVPGTPPAFTINTQADDVMVCGNRFLWDVGGFVHGYRWYAPDASGNFTYEVWAANHLTGTVAQLIAPHVPGSVGWKPIPATGLWRSGNVIDLVIIGRSVTQPNTFSANWQTKNENSNPGSGEAIFRNNNTEVRVSNTDKDDTNQEANLQAIEIGALFQCGGMTWTVTNITTTGTGGGGRHNFFISPNQGRPGENVQPLQWDWGSTDPIPYPVVPNWYSGSPYPNGQVVGFLDDTWPPAATDSSFYGVDVDLEGADVSDDWDFMAYSG